MGRSTFATDKSLLSLPVQFTRARADYRGDGSDWQQITNAAGGRKLSLARKLVDQETFWATQISLVLMLSTLQTHKIITNSSLFWFK